LVFHLCVCELYAALAEKIKPINKEIVKNHLTANLELKIYLYRPIKINIDGRNKVSRK
jgi:hypothetical protein